MQVLHLDIETYSSAPLPKCGVYRYCDSPDFEILILSYAFDNEPVVTIDMACGEKLPDEFLQALEDPNILKIAHNASYERVCFSKHFGHWLDPNQWRCTMVMAWYSTLPGRLADVAVALKLTEQKMEEGKELIRYFSMPCKPTKANGGRTRNMPEDASEKWATYKKYNAQDVETERAVYKALLNHPLPDHEWELYAFDQTINDRGVRIDKALVKSAIAVDSEFSARAYQKAQQITGLDNPGSVAQLKVWLADQDVPMESLAKKLVREKAAETDGIVSELLNLRLELSKTSVKKYEAMARSVCRDGRVHGTLQFYGANRTGRWSGRLVQLQNVPQNHLPDLDLAREIVKQGDTEAVEMLFGSVPNTLSELIRTAFIPKAGCRFIVADFSAIEARVLAWLAGEEWVLEEFRGAGKIYEETASRMYHIPKESIVKGSPNYEYRQKGKQATLSCIAEGVPVLTDEGMIPIEKVKLYQRVWDGSGWVTHMGVVSRGERECIRCGDLIATPDHLVWHLGKWTPFIETFHIEPKRAGIRRVYDILNSGPNHCYTVGGHLVHNCGYGGGVGALKAMGAKMPEEEMQPLVDAWRAANPHIVALWRAMDRAAQHVTKTHEAARVGKVRLYYEDERLFIRLPSGRNLCYISPRIVLNRFGSESFGFLSAMKNGQLAVTESWGATLVENVTQAIARDLLGHGMLNLEAAGYHIVFDVHDEAVMEVPLDFGSVEEACDIMGQGPEWAEGLPLRADGYECNSYRKM